MTRRKPFRAAVEAGCELFVRVLNPSTNAPELLPWSPSLLPGSR